MEPLSGVKPLLAKGSHGVLSVATTARSAASAYLAAETRRPSPNNCDDGELDLHDLLDEAVRLECGPTLQLARSWLLGACVGCDPVRSSGEVLAGAGEDDHPEAVVRRGTLEYLDDGSDGGRVERPLPGRPVDGDPEHAVVGGYSDALVGRHRVAPMAAAPGTAARPATCTSSRNLIMLPLEHPPWKHLDV